MQKCAAYAFCALYITLKGADLTVDLEIFKSNQRMVPFFAGI